MGDELVLTVDVGTGSSRVLVYSIQQGNTLSIVSKNVPIIHPTTHTAEFSPGEWWRLIKEAMSEAVIKAGRSPSDYLGVTVTSLRQSYVLLDEGHDVLGPGILNYDRRGAETIDQIKAEIGIEDLYQLTGHWHAPELTLPKLLWHQKQQPELWKRVESFLFVHDWLLYLLSGEKSTNSSLICAGQMADVHARTWAFDLLASLGINNQLLPPVYEAGYILGGLLEGVASEVGLAEGTPIHVGGGDTQFGCLGAGGMVEGRLVIVGGSTTPIMLTADRPILDPQRYPWVSTHLHPELWAIETNAGDTGKIYKWFRDTFGVKEVAEAEAMGEGPYAILNKLAEESPIGSKGLRVVASSSRWSQDTWEKRAPYTIYNFSVANNLGDFARAIMEGVCFAVRGNIQQMERIMGTSATGLLYTGGTAKPPIWAQMMADVLGRPIQVPQIAEPAAVAGAQVVLYARGETNHIQSTESVVYEPDTGRSEAYQEHYEDYVELFEQMHAQFSISR
jgi:sugar (pentulose or hexulose) kinase